MNNHALAERLAVDAGALLTEIQRAAGDDELGTRSLKDRGDRASQEYLARELSAQRPNDAVLSEEAPDDAGRLSAENVWIIDPLDGTREFSEGRHDWAVHVALWQRGEVTVGAVALPAHDRVLTTSGPQREWRPPTRLRLAVSRTRTTPLVSALADELDAELIPMGSAGYKVAAVIRGEADAYVHTGGQYEWDSAAPVAVARAAGLYTSRIDGSPLSYNNPNPYLPDLVVCNPHCVDRLMDRVTQLSHKEAP